MGIQSAINIHPHLPRGIIWDHHHHHHRRLRPSSAALKSFIRPHSIKQPSPPVESPAGGTRWNPTPEQIGYLEMLYRGGIRTPNAQQIEHITSHLAKYGKIEGKNVFYWFQNHKARERQKQKRISMAAAAAANKPPGELEGKEKVLEGNRNCTEEGGGIRTLELFPLHPEGIKIN